MKSDLLKANELRSFLFEVPSTCQFFFVRISVNAIKLTLQNKILDYCLLLFTLIQYIDRLCVSYLSTTNSVIMTLCMFINGSVACYKYIKKK